jgi:hypothetical protein
MDDQKLEAWEKERGGIIEREDIAHTDLVRAEFHCYRNIDNKCFVPSEHIKQSMVNGGGQVKSKVGNGRKSMTNIVAGLFSIEPEEILIRDFDTIDKRSAVNRNVKARIITIRPRWNKLSLEFTVIVKNDTITSETVKSILEQAGIMYGIGSYRPEHKGEFGVFETTSFKEIK